MAEIQLLVRGRQGAGGGSPAPSIDDYLGLLGSGASGAIVMALGKRAMRTEQLVRALRHYVPRTVYRHSRKLIEAGVVHRVEQPARPSAVSYRLTRPAGRELYRLLEAFAPSWLQPWPEGPIYAESWAAISALSELWGLGVITALSGGGRTVAQLTRECDGFSSHQIGRRMDKFVAARLLEPDSGCGRSKRYTLGSRARQGMGLVAAIGCWRHRYAPPTTEEPLTCAETATVLAAMLPLVELPTHAGKRLALVVDSAVAGRADGGRELVGVRLDACGRASYDVNAVAEADAWIRGSTSAWLAMLLERKQARMKAGGTGELAVAFAKRVHLQLWEQR